MGKAEVGTYSRWTEQAQGLVLEKRQGVFQYCWGTNCRGGTDYEPEQIGQLDLQRPCLLLDRAGEVLSSKLEVPSLDWWYQNYFEHSTEN